MNTTLRQWGNSVGVRIPKEALINSNLQLGDSLDIVAANGVITLQKRTRKKFSDIAQPIITTRGWKFSREEANERR